MNFRRSTWLEDLRVISTILTITVVLAGAAYGAFGWIISVQSKEVAQEQHEEIRHDFSRAFAAETKDIKDEIKKSRHEIKAEVKGLQQRVDVVYRRLGRR